jgi:hypothetical protein
MFDVLEAGKPGRKLANGDPLRIEAIARNGRPRLISDGDIEVIVTAARTRPEKPVQPFTYWSLPSWPGI